MVKPATVPSKIVLAANMYHAQLLMKLLSKMAITSSTIKNLDNTAETFVLIY